MADYYVYILSNVSRTLYVGFTSNLEKRMYEHRMKLVDGFTRRYNITMLVYFEAGDDWERARVRERQLKGWLRQRKVALIEATNPEWRDLSKEFSKPEDVPSCHHPERSEGSPSDCSSSDADCGATAA
ncbi:MAG: GIY-YIG nuclease family protein [Dehalococcoidia bacterium]